MKSSGHKAVAGLLLISISYAGNAFAGPTRALAKGYIQNDKGEKCWYAQTIEKIIHIFMGH